MSAKRIGPRLSFFFFAKKFYRALCTRRDTNEVERTNILAPGFWRLPNDLRASSSRLHRSSHPHGLTIGCRGFQKNLEPMESCIQLQQRNCSRFTRDFSRRSTDQTRKELEGEIGDAVKRGKTFSHIRLQHRAYACRWLCRPNLGPGPDVELVCRSLRFPERDLFVSFPERLSPCLNHHAAILLPAEPVSSARILSSRCRRNFRVRASR